MEFTSEHCLHQASTVSAGEAGQTTITSAAIDIAGWQGITFIVPFGPIAEGGSATIKVEAGNRADMADAVELAGVGHAVTAADANEVKFSEILLNNRHRFHRVIVERADADVTIGAILAILSHSRGNPFPQGLNVSGISVMSPEQSA